MHLLYVNKVWKELHSDTLLWWHKARLVQSEYHLEAEAPLLQSLPQIQLAGN